MTMHEVDQAPAAAKILRDLAAGRSYLVRIRKDGTVSADRLGQRTSDPEPIDRAICNELESALESAFQGHEVGGLCVDEATGELEPVAGYAMEPAQRGLPLD